MISNLRLTMEKNDTHNWLKTGQMELNVKIRGEQDIETLGRKYHWMPNRVSKLHRLGYYICLIVTAVLN